MLKLHLGHIDALDAAIADIERRSAWGWSRFEPPPSS
jgi:hypothetical protein